MNSLITDELMDKTINIKRNVEGLHDNTIRKLTENYTTVERNIIRNFCFLKLKLWINAKTKFWLIYYQCNNIME